MRRSICLWLLLLAGTAAACGRDAALQDLARASERMRAQESAAVSMTMTSQLPESAGGGTITSRGEGAFRFRPMEGAMTFSFSGRGGRAASVAALMGEMEAVYDGLVMYMKWPSMTQNLPKQWLEIDLQEIGKEVGVDFGQLMQMGQNNPTQTLDYLEGTKNVRRVGESDVRGVSTTHYEATVDFALLENEAPENVRPTIARIRELTGVEEAPVEVWLDDEGLPRRISYVFDYNPPEDAPAATPAGRMTIVVEYYDFGTDVEAETPPPDQVMDFEEAMKRAGVATAEPGESELDPALVHRLDALCARSAEQARVPGAVQKNRIPSRARVVRILRPQRRAIAALERVVAEGGDGNLNALVRAWDEALDLLERSIAAARAGNRSQASLLTRDAVPLIQEATSAARSYGFEKCPFPVP